MSGFKVDVLVPPLRPAPSGAMWIGDAMGAAVLAIGAAWRRSNERRAARAAQRIAGLDREEVLALARRYENSQPSFAKDLYAAAARDPS